MIAEYEKRISVRVNNENLKHADIIKKKTGLTLSEITRDSYLFFSIDNNHEILLKMKNEIERIKNEKKEK